MKIILQVISITLLVFCISNCKKDEQPDIDEVVIQDGQEIISGTIDLPDNIDVKSLNIVSIGGSNKIQEDGSFKSSTNKLKKQFLFVENQSGEILFASLIESNKQALNARTTARAMVGLLPWTAYVDSISKLKSMLDEIAQMPEFENLELAIQKSVNNGLSPLNNPMVLEELRILVEKITGNNNKSQNLTAEIPEVDYLVEPIITYSNGNLILKNDGTTTAAWGVELKYKGQSMTDYLILPGNEVQFPSLGSLWQAYKGEYTDAVFSAGETLEIPISIEDKYEIIFASPTRLSNNAELSLYAAQYNIRIGISRILKSLGIYASNNLIKDSAPRCKDELFAGAFELFAEKILTTKITKKEFIDQSFIVTKAYIDQIKQCPLMLNDLGLSNNNIKYINSISQFLKDYSKLEMAFVTGKQIGDMILLNNIDICRQVINGKIYPCFALLKNDKIDNQIVKSGDNVKFEVKTQLDFPTSDSTVFPVGAEIHWEVIEGKGTLKSLSTFVGKDGIAEVVYIPEDEGVHQLKASTKDKNGKYIEFVDYKLNCLPQSYKLGFLDGNPVPNQTLSFTNPDGKFFILLNDNGTAATGIDYSKISIANNTNSNVIIGFTPDLETKLSFFLDVKTNQSTTQTTSFDVLYQSKKVQTINASVNDSTELYRLSAIGKYQVTVSQGNVGNDPESELYCELKADGQCIYSIYKDTHWPDGQSWYSYWSITRRDGRYYYYEHGGNWFSYARDSPKPLTYPIIRMVFIYDSINNIDWIFTKQ